MVKNPKVGQGVWYSRQRAVVVAVPEPTREARDLPKRVCIRIQHTGMLRLVTPHQLQPDEATDALALAS